jgi:hypothetical protein
MRFLEEEPWLKANISEAVLGQTVRKSGLGPWLEQHGYDAYKRVHADKVMAQIDALTPEWRAYVHEHGWAKTKRAMQEFGKRGVQKASVLAGLKLQKLDL